MKLIDHNLHVEYATWDTEAFGHQLVDGLKGYSPAAGTTPDRGWADVYFTVPARDLTDAFAHGLALARAAGGTVPVVSVEVLPTAEFDARLGLEPQTRSWRSHVLGWLSRPR